MTNFPKSTFPTTRPDAFEPATSRTAKADADNVFHLHLHVDRPEKPRKVESPRDDEPVEANSVPQRPEERAEIDTPNQQADREPESSETPTDEATTTTDDQPVVSDEQTDDESGEDTTTTTVDAAAIAEVTAEALQQTASEAGPKVDVAQEAVVPTQGVTNTTATPSDGAEEAAPAIEATASTPGGDADGETPTTQVEASGVDIEQSETQIVDEKAPADATPQQIEPTTAVESARDGHLVDVNAAEPILHANLKQTGADNSRIDTPPSREEAPRQPDQSQAVEAIEQAAAADDAGDFSGELAQRNNIETSDSGLRSSTESPTTTAPPRAEGDAVAKLFTRASSPPVPEDVSPAQQNQLVNRVARAFEAATARNDSTIRLRLHPPQLGSLRLEVQSEAGALSARLEVETSTARDLLLENMVILRQKLAAQDIRVENVDVELMDARQHNQGSANESGLGRQGERDWSTPQQGEGGNNDASAANTETSTAASEVTDGTIDITV